MPLPKTTELKSLYWDKGLSHGDLAIHYKVSQPTISHWFTRLGIKTRSFSERFRNARENNKYKSKYISNGYVWIYKPDYYRGHKGYVQEHIYIWEQANNQHVPTGYVIHHKNGNPVDNNIGNLILLSRREHYLIEKKIKYLLNLIQTKEGKECLLCLIQRMLARYCTS